MAGQKALRTIIAYKAIKGAIEVLAGLALGVTLWLGAGPRLQHLAWALRENVTERVAVEAVELLSRVSNHLVLTALALAVDGAVLLTEALLLHHRKRWAIALVVIATCAFVPWELYELIRHFRLSRLALLIVNVAVAIYLGRQATRHLQLGGSHSSIHDSLDPRPR